MHVLVMFGNGGGVLFMSFYTIVSMFACVTYIACITQVTLEVKLHTGYLQSVALLLSHSVLVQFFGWQTQAGWRC